MTISSLLSMVAEQTHDLSLLLFEFEEVVVVGLGFLVLLMYLFYVRYPYNKEP
jgi:hypothetical protein